MNIKCCFVFAALSLAAVPAARAAAVENAAPLGTFEKLPIREITVFKDGHAFVAHEGEMPTDSRGNVVMDYLPAPVIGTFWPYASDRRASLKSVVAGQSRVSVERTALDLKELLAANIGSEVIITESGTNYVATILSIPRRSSEELAMTNPAGSNPALPQKGTIILLKTAGGVKALPIDRIQDVTFPRDHKPGVASEEFRNVLRLNLDWGNARPARSVNVGLFYLQKGMRWIPNYKIELDGRSNAVVKLQATLINELADLEDVSMNLVVGVPTFAFKDTVDPIALQQNIAQLSQYFQTGTGSQLAGNFSNAIMSQSARAGEYRGAGAAPQPGDLGPDMPDGMKHEDLYVFRVQHVTLRKGERMVMTVAEFTLPYEDVFTLDLPFAPPPELRRNFGGEQQRELARLFNAPKAMHKIRLRNTSKHPITTAPALILREGRVLAQGMTTYTSTGATSDLTVTTAVDIQVRKTDAETKRTPDAMRSNGTSYARVDLAGRINLVNHRGKPVRLEVTRFVLGAADTASHDGKVDKLNAFEDGDYLPAGDYPHWWGWYSWPQWWSHLNGVGRVTWSPVLEPGQSTELNYEWHYFWAN